MRTPLALLAAVLAACAMLARASAAEWPQNYLGQPDGTYRVLHIKVHYYAAVLQDLPNEQGKYPLPLPPTASAKPGAPAAGFSVDSIGGAQPRNTAPLSANQQELAAEYWLEQMASRPELSADSMQAEYTRVVSELIAASRFYWRNSRFNCALDYELYPDFTPRLRSELAQADAPYFSPVDHPAYGDERSQYDGLLQICVLYVFDSETGGLKRVTGGGGFTWGADNEKRLCGWSWWAACTADNVCGSDWLMVHEFGHQLDSLFEQSGHPEFWFNHIAYAEGNIARYGEHFDANAYILRRVPEKDWLNLKWGEVRQYTDADADRVPDVDDWLLQRGLEADLNPGSPDSDGDGLGDLAEFTASNGNRNGHGDRLYPALKPCDLTDPDSDRDGVPDGVDPLPMWPGLAYIPRFVDAGIAPCDVDFTGTLEQLDLGVLIYYMPDVWSDADSTLTYGDLRIYLSWGRSEDTGSDNRAPLGEPTAADAATGYSAKIMLDLQNNGWFAGDDNYRIIVAGDKVARVERMRASSPTEGPTEDASAVDPASVPFKVGGPLLHHTHTVMITLKREQFAELVTKPGTMIGINIGIKKDGEAWFYMLADPNSLMPLELK